MTLLSERSANRPRPSPSIVVTARLGFSRNPQIKSEEDVKMGTLDGSHFEVFDAYVLN